MRIRFLHSTWGMPQPTLEAKLRAIKAGGFDGVELGVPDTTAECAPLRKLLDELGLERVVQQWTRGKTPEEHAASFQDQYERAILLAPCRVNSHSGKDYFSLKDNLQVFERAARLEERSGVPVLHETHRGRALFSIPGTLDLLSARPELKLTADFSHWCCVHESLLEDQAEAVNRAIGRSFYIHARVGYGEGPQIPDPRAPEWEDVREAHLGWWKKVMTRRQAEGAREFDICPEFGPPPYMTVLPHTRQPVADMWQVNCFMRDWVRSRLTLVADPEI